MVTLVAIKCLPDKVKESYVFHFLQFMQFLEVIEIKIGRSPDPAFDHTLLMMPPAFVKILGMAIELCAQQPALYWFFWSV